MHFNKKILVLSLIIFIFCGLACAQETGKNDWKTTEIYYRCSLETENPLWHILFFLTFSSRDFLFKEKTLNDMENNFREIMILNGGKKVSEIRFLNGNFEGRVDIGARYWSAEFKPEQARLFFEILDFIRAAKPGFAYSGNFQNRKSLYRLSINAAREEAFKISQETLVAIYFEGEVWKKSKKYLQAQFWVARGGAMDGHIIKFILEKPHLPTIILEKITEDYG